MTKIVNLIKKHNLQYPLALLGIVLFIFLSNCEPGTWFMGWDNVMQEFSFSTNWERHFTSAWQEYQGVGLEGGQAHAADIPRITINWILDLFLPSNLVRYIYIFGCLYIGSLGMFWLVRWLLNRIPDENKINLSANSIDLIAFSSALFMIFNFGTIQVFFAPMSLFTTQWAALPWLFWYFFRSLSEGTRKNFIMFGIISLVSTPMSLVPTLFVVYAFALAVISMITLAKKWKSKNFNTILKKIALLGLITLAINAFWLLPFLHFVTSGGSTTVSESNINQIFTEDIYNRNRARGTASDVTLLRGYLYDSFDYDSNQEEFAPAMDTWLDHYSNPAITAIGYLSFGVIAIGIAYGIKKKIPYRWELFALFAMSLFVLANSNPPLGFFFDALRDASPLFREALRFPYTKIIQLAIFIYAVLFGFGIAAISELAKKLTKLDLTLAIMLIVAFLSLLYTTPIVSGQLLSNELKVRVPNEYFEMFAWFEEQPQEPRIANLPQTDFLNWSFYDWGNRGTGFIWYGLKQPVLDRSFDNWSGGNEQYFSEMNTAIYRTDVDQIKEIMNKYNVGWIMYDSHIVTSRDEDNPDKQHYEDKLLPLIEADRDFEIVKEFGNKSELVVIEYSPVVSQAKNVEVVSRYASVDSSYRNGHRDEIFSEYGNYIEDPSSKNGNLIIDNRALANDIHVKEINSRKYITSELSLPAGMEIEVPAYWDYESYLTTDVYAKINESLQTEVKIKYNVLEISQNGDTLYPKKPLIDEFILGSRQYTLKSALNAIDISPNTEEYVFQGNLSLTRNDEIEVFERITESHTNLQVRLNNARVANCSKEESGELDEQLFEVNSNENGTTLRVRNAVACVRTTIKAPTESTVAKLTFDYKSDTNNFPGVCIRKPGEENCIEEIKLTSLKSGTTQFEKYENYFTLSEGEKYEVEFALYDSQFHAGVQELTVSDTKIEYLKFSTKLNSKNDKPKADLVVTNSDENILISYPMLENASLGSAVELKELNKVEPQNCLGGSVNPASADYSLDYSDETDTATFSATNADSCALLWVRDRLPMDGNYLVYLENENIEGYPFEIRAINQDLGFAFQRKTVGSTDEDQENALFIPATLRDYTGLSIRIQNLSRGNFRSTNELKSAYVGYYPLDFIQGFKYKSANEDNIKQRSDLEIVDYKRIAPYKYEVTVRGREGVIGLWQGYSQAWQIAGADNTKHQKLNGWANSWYVDFSESNEGNNEKLHKLTIVFWPQNLQYMGYISLFLTLGVFTFLIYRHDA